MKQVKQSNCKKQKRKYHIELPNSFIANVDIIVFIRMITNLKMSLYYLILNSFAVHGLTENIYISIFFTKKKLN